MQGSRNQHHGRSGRSNGNGRKRAAEPEQFPPLTEEANPPPYVIANECSHILTTPEGSSNPNAASLNPTEYYYPASFPGYTVVQVANGDESEALLRRSTTNATSRGARQERTRRLRRTRGMSCGRCCGALSGCFCFIIGALMVWGFLSTVLYMVRHALPGSWDWKCHGLVTQHNHTYSFPAGAPLRLESSQGMSTTDVYIGQHSTLENSAILVRAVVEANPLNWQNWITVDTHTASTDEEKGERRDESTLAVRIQRQHLEWPRNCVRSTLHISVPELDSDGAITPFLQVVAGTGRLQMIDVGRLALDNLGVDMHDGVLLLRNATVQGAMEVLTTNSRIDATDVAVGTRLRLSTTNGAVLLKRTTAGTSLAVGTSSAAVRAVDVSAPLVSLHTVNAPITVYGLSASKQLAMSAPNGAIRGTVKIGDELQAHASNAHVELNIVAAEEQPVESRHHRISVRSSNAEVGLSLAGIRGSFDVQAFNSRALVEGPDDLISYTQKSPTIKSGTVGDADAGKIEVVTSNSKARLRFE
ncbi:hypothetical protein H4S08_004737 [Coemansia sp. RSA 1365]|nr:hypothetical protein H4S08_004737 [Coemansia sp. RSA 1365]